MAQLLISIRSVAEVGAVLAGGAALLDVKEPKRGPLGRADDAVIAGVLEAVAGRVPVSAALGELAETPEPPSVRGLAFVKWGLAGCGRRPIWRQALARAAAAVHQVDPACRVVAVAYADWRRADSPPPEEVRAFAPEFGAGALLLDTWGKDGATLLAWMDTGAIAQLCALCRADGVSVALAGSLGPQEIETLRPAGPDWFAVRGSACRGGSRVAAVDADAVRRLVELLGPVGQVFNLTGQVENLTYEKPALPV